MFNFVTVISLNLKNKFSFGNKIPGAGTVRFLYNGAPLYQLESGVLGMIWGTPQLSRLSGILGGLPRRFDRQEAGTPAQCAAFWTLKTLCTKYQ